MKQRMEKDIWRGLNDFYLKETPRRQKPELIMKTDKLLANAVILGESKSYRHVLTHQRLLVRFVITHTPVTKKMKLLVNKMGLKWFSKEQIEQIPKPILIDRFLKEKIHDREFW